jgi:hypothetical protein
VITAALPAKSPANPPAPRARAARWRWWFRAALALVVGPPLALMALLILVKCTGWTALAFAHWGIRPCYCLEAYEDAPSGRDPIHPMVFFDANLSTATKFSELTNYPTVKQMLDRHAYVDGVLIYWPSAATSGTSGELLLLTTSSRTR